MNFTQVDLHEWSFVKYLSPKVYTSGFDCGVQIENSKSRGGSTPTSLPRTKPNNYPQPHLFWNRSLK